MQFLSIKNDYQIQQLYKNSLIYQRQMRRLAYTITRFKFGTLNEKQILQKYNSMIQQLKLVKDKQKSQKIRMDMAEMSLKLNKLKKEQNLAVIKEYLKEGFSELNVNNQNDQLKQTRQYIPPNLVVKKLKFMNKKILLLGVQQQNEDHCIYLKKVAERMGTKIILTSLPPDMPYFIKTQLSFSEEWKKFVTDSKHAKESKFYLNPTPYYVNDFCLNKIQKQLVRSSLGKSKQFNQIFFAILQYSKRHNKFLPNALLTPLLINGVDKIYFCDYPILKQRELWALTIPVNQLRKLFKVFHLELYKNKQMLFDPRILFPASIIGLKFQHMANAIKYASHEVQQPAIFVCPAEYVQMFCMQWKKDKPVTSISNFSSFVNTKTPTTFIDFVEKLVILDIMLEPVIDKYFIQNLSFPYTAMQTLGGKQNIGKIFIVWKHFHNLYKETLQKQPNY